MADSKLRKKSPEKGNRSVPLTPSNVMRAVREVERWWDDGGLRRWLYIPWSKEEEIRQNFPHEMDQKKQAISYWISTDPLASWRRLITALDCMRETKLADSIRSNAEPVIDAITPHTLLHAVSTVRRFWGDGLLRVLGVPSSVYDQIRDSQSYSSEDERRMAGLQYYLQTLPGVSWGKIAGELWYMKEHTALETVRQYLPHNPDPSLTLSNMTSALDNLPDTLWYEFGSYVDVPRSKRNKIRSQFHSDGARKREVFRIYLSEHPQPTWEHVSNVLYKLDRISHGSEQCHCALDRLQSVFPTGRRRAKQIYEEEMKRGVSKRVITKVVMVGVAGSGKSTSLETVMGEKPPAEKDRESTPLLKRPVQTEVIYIKNNVKWVKKTPEEKKRYIASLLRARAHRLGQPSAQTEDSTSASTPTPATPTSVQSTPVQRAASTHQSSTATPPTRTYATPTSAATTATEERSSSAAPEVTIESLLQSSEVDDELISLINIPSDSLETILIERCVYIVDSGGQPEFIDAMTVFMGQTSACILVIDLSQSLDDYPMIGYYRKGKLVSKPYLCTRTNEDNLKQCMRTMHTFTSKTKGPLPKLLFLGTHLDKLYECETETVKDKNKRLKKIIPPKFEGQIIWFNKEKLIFEMNALNPDDTDKKTAERVRCYIIEQCPTVEVEIPMRWHTFEQKLRSFAESLGRMVMSRHECWQVAESLGLDEASFDSALDFLHSVSLMFYFRDVLPEVVFVDPQVVLDKVSEVIEFMFELREPADQDEPSHDTSDSHTGKQCSKPSEKPSDDATSTPEKPIPKKVPSTMTPGTDLLPPGWQQFNKFGQITKPFLEDKRFRSHYHAGIFTTDDVIHLLEELLVFAKLSTDDGPDTWFMPSVLKQVPAEEMREVYVSAGALVVGFPDGGPQNGIFCSLMSHVLSPENHHPCPWKLRLSSDEPACLYRDCIQFQVPEYIGSVTLIDRYDYFEVHVFTSEDEMQELWQHTRNALFSGIETVCETLGYSNNKPRPAIVCPAAHTGKTHPAYIKNNKWACTSDSCEFGYLRDLNVELHWCEESCKTHLVTSTAPSSVTSTTQSSVTSTTPSSVTSSQPTLTAADEHSNQCPLDIGDLFTINSELLPVAHKWRRIGLALRLDPDLLDRIHQRNHVDVGDYLTDVLTEWLKKAYDVTRFGAPSWKLLVEAVAHRAGGNDRALAERVAGKYKVPPPPLS